MTSRVCTWGFWWPWLITATWDVVVSRNVATDPRCVFARSWERSRRRRRRLFLTGHRRFHIPGLRSPSPFPAGLSSRAAPESSSRRFVSWTTVDVAQVELENTNTSSSERPWRQRSLWFVEGERRMHRRQWWSVDDQQAGRQAGRARPSNEGERQSVTSGCRATTRGRMPLRIATRRIPAATRRILLLITGVTS